MLCDGDIVRRRAYSTTLFDDLHDAARARLHQHGLAVHDRVAIRYDAKRLRHVVIGHAGFRQHAADDHTFGNAVIGHAFAHDIFTKRRPLFDRDALDILIDDHGAAAHHARGGLALGLRGHRRG